MKEYNLIIPCPIIDALFEIRFTSSIPSNAILGVVYSSIKESYPHYEGLPILQIPEELRKNDATLKYCPENRFIKENFIFQIGPSVLSISSYPNYVGWESFKQEIENCLCIIKKIGLINRLERLGLRYIDAFDFPILDYSNYNLKLPDMDTQGSNTIIKTEFSNNQINNILRIGNNAIVMENDKRKSVIDIDTFTICQEHFIDFFEKPSIILNQMHDSSKKLFFMVLNERIKEKLEFK